MAEGRFRRFLARSLERLAVEAPGHYRALASAVAPRQVVLRVDDEVVGLVVAAASVVVAPALRPAVELRTDRTTLLALVRGGHLLEAILDDRLFLRGAPADLVAFEAGLRCYLHGAVRAPSLPPLLDAYREGVPLPKELDHG